MPRARAGPTDYCATPARFDQPLHVPGRDGLQGFLPVESDAFPSSAVKRTAPVRGLRSPRASADATASIRRSWRDTGAACASGCATRLRSRPSRIGTGSPVDTANDGNGETLVGAGRDVRLRVHGAQPRRPVLVPPASARQRRRRRRVAACSASSWSRTTTSSRCAARSTSCPAKRRFRWCSTTAVAARRTVHAVRPAT